MFCCAHTTIYLHREVQKYVLLLSPKGYNRPGYNCGNPVLIGWYALQRGTGAVVRYYYYYYYYY
jgi:hypothetical protein